MTVEVYWDNEQHTVLRYETSGQWTTSEFWDAYNQAGDMLNSVDHRVYFILIPMDTQSMNHVPNGFITQVGSIFRNQHPRAGHVIIVRKAHTILGQIYEQIVIKTLPHIVPKFDFADSLEQAREKLAERVAADQLH
jgi:hypothetical protein